MVRQSIGVRAANSKGEHSPAGHFRGVGYAGVAQRSTGVHPEPRDVYVLCPASEGGLRFVPPAGFLCSGPEAPLCPLTLIPWIVRKH